MTQGIEGKVVLVTGGGSGIGRAIALTFAREGSAVVVSDVSGEGGNETVRLIMQNGGEAIFIQCDVSKAVEVQGMIQKIIKTFGQLDYAVNNAGIAGIHKYVADYPEDIWNKVLNINLTGVWLCMKHEISQMLSQGGGAIVNIASIAGFAAQRGASPYIASKHGVIGLTKAAALEYAKTGIRVNAVCPGITATPLIENARSEVPSEINKIFSGETIPMGRIALPEEIAGAVIWLCSNAASFVTGHALVVDGGMIAE
ncbi:MAG: short chain dehydrogenase [Deltaproteobacteria bacterium RBG_13_52_11]|nr:MAG: short chain dehydrogenase [Deltaproteobacteria bacterium RBG_13_52_11]